MQSWVDYYKVLQVDSLAEVEVIEGAYKRLAKKYHPDVNASGDSHSKMKQINEAYEWLRDPGKREKYDAEWIRRQHHQAQERPREQYTAYSAATSEAQAVLKKYFTLLEQGDFDHAYELISSQDKKRISLADYQEWRGAVDRVFSLHAFECKSSAGNLTDHSIMEFVVMTLEHNIIMDRMEKDIFVKKMILERKGWRVHIGHYCVKTLTNRFAELTNLLKARSVLQDMLETYSNTDYETGLLSKKGFIDVLEKEVDRRDRYGNRFSLMMIELSGSMAAASRGISSLSRKLKQSLRRLDEVGRWDQQTVIALLPETQLTLCIKAALRVRERIGKDHSIYIAATEYKESVEGVIDTLHQHMGEAKRQGPGCISSDLGVWKK